MLPCHLSLITIPISDCCQFSDIHISQGSVASGVLLKMEVGIRKEAWRRAWRYTAYLWSLRWVYAVKKTRRLVYAVYPRIPPNTPLSVATGEIFKYGFLQIYHWVCQWKNCENRLLFGEVMGKSLMSCCLLTHGVFKEENAVCHFQFSHTVNGIAAQ